MPRCAAYCCGAEVALPIVHEILEYKTLEVDGIKREADKIESSGRRGIGSTENQK